jgi:hypothetical protein
MKNLATKTPEYARCPVTVKRRIESVFAWTLAHNPYPQSMEERIGWIHSMDKALRDIEAESVVLDRLGG